MDLGEEGTRISGIRVIQHSDYSFTWHMNEYVKESMTPIQVPRGFISQTEKLDEDRMSEVVSLNGKIGWLGGNGRPDLAAGHSIIAGQYKDALPSLITQCNQCVKQAREHVIKLRIWPIKP